MSALPRNRKWSWRVLSANLNEETGQGMVEYVMIVVLVGLAVFILSPNVRDAILRVFQHTSSSLS